MISSCPGLISSVVRPFAAWIAATVVPKRAAINPRVSPDCTM